jgi:hypothetical protein
MTCTHLTYSCIPQVSDLQAQISATEAMLSKEKSVSSEWRSHQVPGITQMKAISCTCSPMHMVLVGHIRPRLHDTTLEYGFNYLYHL